MKKRKMKRRKKDEKMTALLRSALLTPYGEGAYKSGSKNCLFRTLPGQLAAAGGDPISAVRTYVRNKKQQPVEQPPSI